MSQPGIKFYKKGLNHYKQGRYDQSINYFEKAIKKDIDFAKAWMFRGLSLSALSQEKEALECYDHSIDINPKNSFPWIYKGNSFLKLKQYDNALLCYDKAIEIAPRNDLAWVYKGKILSILGNDQEAICCFDKGLEIKPKDSWAMNSKGNSYLKLEDYPKAISCFENAININSRNWQSKVWSWANKGIALYKTQDHVGANNSLDEALEIFRYEEELGGSLNPAIAWYFKGHAQNGLGNVDSAKECYHKADFFGINIILDREPRYEILLRPPDIKKIDPGLEHTYIQYLLLELGGKWGFDVWIARNDQGKDVNGIYLKNMRGFLKELNLSDDQICDTVEWIDVVWLKDNKVVAAFEVENTTSIYSGLFRMLDLIAIQPDYTNFIYIVSPDSRKGDVLKEVNRPAFSKLLQNPLFEICKYISSSRLEKFMLTHKDVLEYLNKESLATISEIMHVD
jgi:tetratricopeptide (TPR) repeat protein